MCEAERRFEMRPQSKGIANLYISVRHPNLYAAERFKTTAIVVLGMHRSGTSSVAGTLVRLGGTAPLHMMPPAACNERGFWESRVIAEMNDAILAAGGSSWRDWRKFDPARIDDAAADALRARAKAILAEEFGGACFPIIKAPRMCRLLRFWAPVFREAEWSVRAILPIRSPLEVGWSLNVRDRFGTSYGCLLWLRHVLDAEAETRGLTRAVLSWPEFLKDRRRALARVGEQLDVIWPHWGEGALAEIDEFVSADLRHQRASEDDLRAHPAISDLVRETYAAMLELVRDPGDGCVLRRLDALRARLESAETIFDHPMRELEEKVRSARNSLSERIAEANRDIARAESIIGHIANRFAEKRRPSKSTWFRYFWKTGSKSATPSFVELEGPRGHSQFSLFLCRALSRSEPGRSRRRDGPCAPLLASRRP